MPALAVLKCVVRAMPLWFFYHHMGYQHQHMLCLVVPAQQLSHCKCVCFMKAGTHATHTLAMQTAAVQGLQICCLIHQSQASLYRLHSNCLIASASFSLGLYGLYRYTPAQALQQLCRTHSCNADSGFAGPPDLSYELPASGSVVSGVACTAAVSLQQCSLHGCCKACTGTHLHRPYSNHATHTLANQTAAVQAPPEPTDTQPFATP